MESAQVMGLAELPPGAELAAALATVDLSQVPNGEIITVLRACSRQRAHEEARFLAVTGVVVDRAAAAQPAAAIRTTPSTTGAAR